MEVGKMPAKRKANDSRRLTVAGLIAVTAATLLMMAWAVFPGSAVAAPTPDLRAGNVSCKDLGLLDASGQITITGSEEEGTQQVAWSSSTPIDAVIVKGGNFSNVYSYNEALSDSGLVAPFNQNSGKPYGVSHVDLCYDEDEDTTTTDTTTTDTTTTDTTTTDTTTTDTTTTDTTTTDTTTTDTTTTGTTTTVPGGGGGGGGTTTVPVTTTTTPTVGPTTVQPSTTTKSPNVAPTTVSPRGTAFTGVENVVPIGAIALMLMTSGTGLLWAGSRRRRDQNQDEE
jgi:hypothetical protein